MKTNETRLRNAIINGISFDKEEYEVKTKGDGYNTFDEFINAIVSIVLEVEGTIEDGIFIANDAYEKL